MPCLKQLRYQIFTSCVEFISQLQARMRQTNRQTERRHRLLQTTISWRVVMLKYELLLGAPRGALASISIRADSQKPAQMWLWGPGRATARCTVHLYTKTYPWKVWKTPMCFIQPTYRQGEVKPTFYIYWRVVMLKYKHVGWLVGIKRRF